MFLPLFDEKEQKAIDAGYQRWASWTLYWLGDKACNVMHLHANDDDRFAKQWVGFWYPVYNKLMLWSSDVQGETENGPWRAVQSDEEDSSPEQDQQS